MNYGLAHIIKPKVQVPHADLHASIPSLHDHHHEVINYKHEVAILKGAVTKTIPLGAQPAFEKVRIFINGF